MLDRHQLVVIVVSTVVVAVSAYDFHDEQFNILLADQMEDWESSAVRVKREMSSESHMSAADDHDDADKFLKCKHHHGKMCCGKGKWLKHFGDKGKQLLSDCFGQVNEKMNATGITMGSDPFSCSRVNQMKMKMICTTECVGRKNDLIAEDGSLKTETALSYIDKKMSLDEWQKKLVESAIKKCAPELNKTKVSTPDTADIECSPVMISLQHCLYQEVEKNCPEDQKKSDGKCKRNRDKPNTFKL